MKNGKRRGQKKQKRKGAYDKSGGITHDTAAFAFRTKDILKIRSRPRLEPGSDYHYLSFVDKKDAVEKSFGVTVYGICGLNYWLIPKNLLAYTAPKVQRNRRWWCINSGE